ncbi:hypothetical protein ACUNWD_12075 [Sunxiuqinia sp. A32]|uniref:hypothetical protein n=1 Tax=Sunxiuqinia sp. A32 TaxID=3461496 RepID=UPI0040457D93
MSRKTKISQIQIGEQDEVVILGNGPSLKKMISEYPDFLDGKDLVCVNHFPTTDEYQKLKPKYLIASAEDLFLEDIDQRFIDKSKRLFDNINKKTDWPLIFLFPAKAKKYKRWQEQIKNNKNITVYYYNTTPIEGLAPVRNFLFNLKAGMVRPHNIMIPSMFVMTWLGYKKIYIWGADHSWLKDISVTENNEALINEKHFYDENESKSLPLVWKKNKNRRLHEILYKFMTAFKGYFTVQEYAESKQVDILNCTKGSFIDAFNRIDLEDYEKSKI